MVCGLLFPPDKVLGLFPSSFSNIPICLRPFNCTVFLNTLPSTSRKNGCNMTSIKSIFDSALHKKQFFFHCIILFVQNAHYLWIFKSFFYMKKGTFSLSENHTRYSQITLLNILYPVKLFLNATAPFLFYFVYL